MEWVKYNSIDNLTTAMTQKGYEPLSVNIPTDPNVTWIGVEKVHGANFSIIYKCESGEINYARRRDILKQDERFYDYLNVMKEHEECVQSVIENVKKIRKDPEMIVIYGELFGGKYNHKDVPKSTIKMGAVQKEIDYHPEFKFIPFDIKVNKSFLNWDELNNVIKETKFKILEPLVKGDYETVANFEVEQQITKIPDLYNLPPIEHNFMEGIIIRPVEELYNSRYNRIIIKKKTKKFTEKVKIKKDNKNPQKEIPEHIHKISNELKCYINKNRLISVISKETEVTRKDTGKLIKLLNDDAVEDYEKENEAISSKDLKIIRKIITPLSLSVVKTYFDNLTI